MSLYCIEKIEIKYCRFWFQTSWVHGVCDVKETPLRSGHLTH